MNPQGPDAKANLHIPSETVSLRKLATGSEQTHVSFSHWCGVSELRNAVGSGGLTPSSSYSEAGAEIWGVPMVWTQNFPTLCGV